MPDRKSLAGKRITLGVCGSIAAFKAPMVLRDLVERGARVQAVLTPAAQEFIGKATFSGLSGELALTDAWSAAGELHVELARRDALVIVPATADCLARLEQGRADDLLTATALCTRAPIVIAPAMHPNMWSHPATQRNVERLRAFGNVTFVGPVEGLVASGENGMGRMAEPSLIADEVERALTPHDLAGVRIVVTAGPTVEDLDPVRFLTNRSSGKMGFQLAARAAQRGATVTLISGPVALETPPGVRRVEVRSAIAMRGAVWQAMGPDFGAADALFMAAAVGDYRFTETFASKQKRIDATLSLQLTQNPDIVREIGEAREGTRPVLVAFSVETENDAQAIEYARQKLNRKRVDLVVANRAEEAFGRDSNRATLVSASNTVPLNEMDKSALADRLLDWLYQRLWDTAHVPS